MTRPVAYSLTLAGLISLLLVPQASPTVVARAADGNAFVRQAQVLEAERTGLTAPAGLAFSSPGGAFYVTEAGPAAAETEVVRLNPFRFSPQSDRTGQARIQAAVRDPINLAFDSRHRRALLLDHADRLLEVKVDADGDLDPRTLVRRDALRLDLRDPQGMSVDPASGNVFILDAAQPRLVRVEPAADGSFDAAAISEVDLRPGGVTAVRGLAIDPSTGHVHLRGEQTLYELTVNGEIEAARDLAGLDLVNPQGMVFAPSGDQTDDPAQPSLYVADSGGGARGSSGQIVELSLTPVPSEATSSFAPSLVNEVNLGTGGLSPPSPDSSGIGYVSSSNTLLIVDGEVEETVSGITHFLGANVWELTLAGAKVRSTNVSNVPPTVLPISDEPVGVAFNPSNGHCFISDDSAKEVHELTPGADGLCATADDTSTSFDTLALGNTDPEGVAYDATFTGHLFVADGINNEVYEYTTAGTLVGHFDTFQYGVSDPESVEVNSVTGTLFVLSNAQSGTNGRPIIIETTRGGSLLQTLVPDETSVPPMVKPAGLAYAPGSTAPTEKHFYVVDRGVDNNSDPNAVDGKMFELTAPPPGTPGNVPPTVNAGSDQTIALPAVANLNGTVSDDGLPAPPSVTTAWSQVSGPSTVAFGNTSAEDTTASVPIPGTYVVRLTADDGEFSAFDEVTLTFTGTGSVDFLDVRVGAASDDAEEVAGTGQVQRGDGDLDMMTDTTDTKLVVGMRLNGVAIPPGANITNAYLQFQADESFSVATSLTIKGQDADNAPTFQAVNFDISSRPTTNAGVPWSPAPWTIVGEMGLPERSPNLAAVIQEIVDRPGWASGNSIVLMVTGSGRRVAESYNATPTGAPLLHVEWGGSADDPPTVSLTAPANGATVSGTTVNVAANASDDGGVTQVEFFLDGSTSLGIDTTFPYSVFWNTTTATEGAHSLTARATDTATQTTTSAAVNVTVDNVGGGGSPLYFSLGATATVGGITAANEDVVFFDGTGFSLYFDGSDVSLGSLRIDAFTRVDSNTLLLSFDAAGSVPGVGTVDDSDIVQFEATSLGNVTTGSFTLFFDGSAFGLTANGEDVDAVELLANGHFLVSTVGAASVPGASGADEDLLEFNPATSTYSLYFDGSAFGLTASGEDVDAAAVDTSGHIYLSTINAFAVPGVSGQDEDVFVFDRSTGTYSSTLYFDGSAFNLGAHDLFSIDLP
jgi:hypothetical protein